MPQPKITQRVLRLNLHRQVERLTKANAMAATVIAHQRVHIAELKALLMKRSS